MLIAVALTFVSFSVVLPSLQTIIAEPEASKEKLVAEDISVDIEHDYTTNDSFFWVFLSIFAGGLIVCVTTYGAFRWHNYRKERKFQARREEHHEKNVEKDKVHSMIEEFCTYVPKDRSLAQVHRWVCNTLKDLEKLLKARPSFKLHTLHNYVPPTMLKWLAQLKTHESLVAQDEELLKMIAENLNKAHRMLRDEIEKLYVILRST